MINCLKYLLPDDKRQLNINPARDSGDEVRSDDDMCASFSDIPLRLLLKYVAGVMLPTFRIK